MIKHIMKNSDEVIPYENLKNGSIIALDNARKLANSMNQLYDAELYESATILGTLAIEEYGKYLHLRKKHNERQSISTNDDIFHKHDKKIKAIINYYNDNKNKTDIEKFRNTLKILNGIRFNLLYANWDRDANKWIKEIQMNRRTVKRIKDIIKKLISNHIE